MLTLPKCLFCFNFFLNILFYFIFLFHKRMNTFTITSQPFYDQCNQCYKNILMVNVEPKGPLRKFVRRIQLPKLSPFHQEGPCIPIPKCGLALQQIGSSSFSCCSSSLSSSSSSSSCSSLMTPNEMPDLITFLLANGYQLETQLTNMLNQSEVKIAGNKKIAFIVTYYESAQPNITYMR